MHRRTALRYLAPSLALPLVLHGACHAGQPPKLDYRPQTVIPRAFPAIKDPPLVAAGKSPIADNELVIGVRLEGVARAYPINQLTGPRREIINDELVGTAIAATW